MTSEEYYEGHFVISMNKLQKVFALRLTSSTSVVSLGVYKTASFFQF